MLSSASSSPAARSDRPLAPPPVHYAVVAFRRTPDGAVVPGPLLEVENGDIAWRCARAAAFDHANVGAAELRDGVILAQFGTVDPATLAH